MSTTQRTAEPTTTERPPGEHCPECDGPLDESGRETFCDECGLVVDENQLDRGWWQRLGDNQKKRGVYVPGKKVDPGRGDGGIGSIIGHGKKGTLHSNADWRKRRHNKWARMGGTVNRNRQYATGEAQRIAEAVETTKVVENLAARLLKSAADERLFKGRDLDGFAAAAVYIAGRITENSVTSKQIRAVARCDRAAFRLANRVLQRELDVPVPPRSPETFVPRLAGELDVSDEVRQHAEALARAAAGTPAMNGRKPDAFAVSCLWVAKRDGGDRGFTKREAATAAECSPQTIRNNEPIIRELEVEWSS